MAERLLRFQHMILLMVLLILPTLSVMPELLRSPFLFMALPNATPSPLAWMAVSILLHATYVLWIAIQKEAIMGGPSRAYLSTLPLPQYVQKKIDFRVLLIANHLFWLPILLSCVNLLQAPHAFLPLLYWLQLVCSLGLAQWLYLQGRYILLVCTSLLASSFLVLALWMTNAWLSLFIGGVSIFSLVLVGVFIENKSPRIHPLFRFLNNHHSLRLRWKILSFLKINQAILFRKYRQESTLRVLFVCLAFIILYLVSTRTSLAIEHTYPIVIALSLLITSGWYNKLALEHQQYDMYLASLPVPQAFRDFLDICTVMLITWLLQSLFFIPFWTPQTFSVTAFLSGILIQVPLIMALYLAQTRLSKWCQTVSTVTTGLWLSLFFI